MGDGRIRKTLRLSVWEGSFASAMVGFGESFFGAFAVLLKAASIELSLLGSLPQLLGSLLQLFTVKLMRVFGSRKRLVVTGVVLQMLMLIPLSFVFLAGSLSVPLLLLFVSLYFIFGMMVSPAWSSWIGDMVEPQERGSYFGMRNRVSGIVSFVAFVGAGLILQYFKDSDLALYGFLVIFALALVSRIISLFYFLGHYEPAYEPPGESRAGFVSFIKGASSTNYGLLVFFLASMNFAVGISGPFFAAYMLNDLGFTYWTYTIAQGTIIIVKYSLMPVWGKAADRYGSRRVLMLTGFLLPFIPVLWMLGTSLQWIVFIQVISGFVWAGFELASFNFLLDATEPHRRAEYLSYYNVTNGIFVFVGAVAGGLLVKYNHVFWSQIWLVFLVSGIARLFVWGAFALKVKEVRTVEHIEYRDLLLDVMHVDSTVGVVQQTFFHTPAKIIEPLEERAKQIIEPFEKSTKRIIRPLRSRTRKLTKPIEEIADPIVREQLEIVQEASRFPKQAVQQTITKIEKIAKREQEEVATRSSQIEEHVTRDVRRRLRRIRKVARRARS